MIARRKVYSAMQLLVVAIGAAAAAVGAAEPRPVLVVVMDPLAAQLSCPCVKGYAQRDYKKLGEFLAEKLARPVEVKFGESLEKALIALPGRHADLVIGKRSVVASDGKRCGRALHGVAALTGKDGSVMQRGLVVVRASDPAKNIADLKNHRVILGPVDCEEKHAAARELFREHGLALASDGPLCESCSDGAAEVVEAGENGRVATVISSYAQPLLEGCGAIKKGDLRVVGQTREAPFITAFVDDASEPELRQAIVAALLDVKTRPLLRLALESKRGFEPLPAETPAAGAATAVPGDAAPRDASVESAVADNDWPGWRGARRDAVVSHLPERLPDEAAVVWKKTLLNEGLGGPAVSGGLLVVGDRDVGDSSDLFHAVDAATGERRWSLRYPASGRLDYGNSPRATPLLHGGKVYTLGAFGHLHCVRASDGKIVWKKHLREAFQVREPLVWGVCSSPLIVDGKLVVNPGAPDASLAALDPNTGELLWKTPGGPAAFSSFIAGEWGGRSQILGYDKTTFGGWSPSTGRRLWTLPAKTPGDFNVPTPVAAGDKVLLVGENNGARLLAFESEGEPRVVGAYDRLAPDMHTPVAAGNRIFAVHKNRVYCFAADSLQLLWSEVDRSLQGHVSLIASQDRLLLLTQRGELVLVDALADRLRIVSRRLLLGDDVSLYAHPALADDRLYVRGPSKLVCLSLRGG